MYKMSVFEHLLNDINEILEFAYIELNKTHKLLVLCHDVRSLIQFRI